MLSIYNVFGVDLRHIMGCSLLIWEVLMERQPAGRLMCKTPNIYSAVICYVAKLLHKPDD